MTPVAVPFCRDCRYYAENPYTPYVLCCHPTLGTLDVVSGRLLAMHASEARAGSTKCGREGTLFEAKPPKPVRWYQRLWR